MYRQLILAAALGALATAAAAQPEPERPQLFISPAGEPFRKADGFAAWFAGADADHDGAITLAEFRADALRYFKVLDANADSQLDAFEIQAYERQHAPEIAQLSFAGRGGAGGPRGTFGAQGAGAFGLLNIPQPVANADQDLNGRVTLDEWTRTATRRFTALDKTQAGKLTLETLTPPKPAKRKRGR